MRSLRQNVSIQSPWTRHGGMLKPINHKQINRNLLPSSDIRLRLPEHTRLFDIELAHREVLVYLRLIIVRVLFLQIPKDMRVQLLELQQKPIVPIRRVDDHKLRLRDMLRDLLLLRDHEQPVRLHADDECAGWERLEHGGEGERLVGGALDGDGVTVPRDVVRVELARDMDVAVGVESGGEFVALVAQVGLGGVDGWLGWWDGGCG